MKPETVLAIESAVAGGSLALTSGRTVVGKWHNPEQISRSEELLPRIAELLEQANVDRRELSKIAVSNGPGSYTGIRIGIATAMGFARALEIPCIGVSLLKAIATGHDAHGERVVVIPIGRDGYCWQRFPEKTSGKKPVDIQTGKASDLVESLKECPEAKVLAHGDARSVLVTPGLVESISDRVVDIGRDLAVAVAFSSASEDDGLEPLYVRDISTASGKGAQVGN